MGCLDIHILREYLDRELEPEEMKLVQNHLKDCSKCQQELKVITDNDRFVNSVLSQYAEEVEEVTPGTGDAWNRMKTKIISDHKRRLWGLNTRYVRAAVAAAVTLCIVGTLSFGGVRGALADLLTIFRVEKIQTISITPQEITQMEEAIRNGIGNINVENFGQIKVDGKQESTICSLEEAQGLVDFRIKTPPREGYVPLEARVQKSSQMSLTLDVARVNAMIQSLNGTQLLPAELDHKYFTVNVPNSLSVEYGTPQGLNPFSLTQMRSPELQVPDGVNVEVVRDALLSLPIWPERVRSQLAGINDWQNTIFIPNAGQNSEVLVRGQQGVYITNAGSAKAGLAWSEEGVVYCLYGSFSQEQALQLAESLR